MTRSSATGLELRALVGRVLAHGLEGLRIRRFTHLKEGSVFLVFLKFVHFFFKDVLDDQSKQGNDGITLTLTLPIYYAHSLTRFARSLRQNQRLSAPRTPSSTLPKENQTSTLTQASFNLLHCAGRASRGADGRGGGGRDAGGDGEAGCRGRASVAGD